MFTIASQSFANGIWTITPEEPATLPLALVGLGTLAVYAALMGWRPRRTAAIADPTANDECRQTHRECESTNTERAA